MLQRCAFKKRTCISLCHRFHFSRSPTLRGAFLPSTVSKSHTSQSIRVCSSHFLHSLLVFFVSGILVTFSKCQILALRHCACAHTSPPPKLHAHTHTNTQGAETHTPRLEPGPSVLVYLREAGAWHREEALVDSVLRLPMLLFWSAASWWQIYIKLIVFSPSLCFSSPPPWHRGKMLL